jgi:DNA-binding XRE family transcriptional regulator
MRGAGDELSVGDRVAFYRRRRGLTQATLAAMVGRSEDWLSKVERGDRQVRRLDVISELAQALRVPLDDLFGQPVLLEDDQATDDDVPAVREALMSHRRLSRTLFGGSGTPPDLDSTERIAEFAWTDYQRGRTGKVVTALPNLLRSAQALEDAPLQGQETRCWAASARIHHLAATTLAKIGEVDLAWIAAERAMTAGERSGDPVVLASAARAGTHALLAVGRFDEAVDLGETAAEWLKDHVSEEDPVALSVLGMLYLRTAVAAAHRQDRSTTNELLAAASEKARMLGRDGNYWHTSFGPTNVALHRVATGLSLDDVSWVIENGSRVDSSHMPVERSVAHKIDLARANSYQARDDDALTYLLDAEQSAPQLVRHSAVVREVVKAMLRRARASVTGESPLAGLAERCRAI